MASEFELLLTDQDGEEYPYSESVDTDGYLYELSVTMNENDQDALFCITKHGCHFIFKTGEWLDTAIIPSDIFPNSEKLSPKELLEILAFAHDSGNWGRTYTKMEIDASYKRFRIERDSAG